MYLLENISISTAVFCDMFSTMLSFSVENGNLGPHFPIYDFNFYCLVQWNILLPLSKTAENVFTLLELNLLFTKVAENDFTLVINKNHRKCYKKNQGKSTPLANQMTFYLYEENVMHKNTPRGHLDEEKICREHEGKENCAQLKLAFLCMKMTPNYTSPYSWQRTVTVLSKSHCIN